MQAPNKSTRLETMDMEVHPLDQDVPPTQKGTVLDDHDMQRMGKIQELKVCRLLSAETGPPPLIEVEPLNSHIPRPAKYATGGCLEFCFDFTGNVGVHFDVSCICGILGRASNGVRKKNECSWLTVDWTVFRSNDQGLENGGLPGMFWSFIWTFIGFGFIIASLSEMASMAPTSGGQYHWVSEFSSPRHQKFLSYITGWMSVLAWQAGAASGSFLTGTIIQGLISVRNPEYEPKNWQGTLFVFAMVLVIYIANVYASDLMPVLSNLLMILHVLSWAVVLIVLWAMAPHQSAKTVFVTGWQNGGGWSSMGLSVMIGQISAIYGSLSMYWKDCSDLYNILTAGDRLRCMCPYVRRGQRCWPIRPRCYCVGIFQQRHHGGNFASHISLLAALGGGCVE